MSASAQPERGDSDSFLDGNCIKLRRRTICTEVHVARICIIGCGHVGLVTAACLAELGHEIVCVDVDTTKIETLNSGGATIHEQYLPELLARHRGRNLRFSSDLPQAVAACEVVFIAVNTPQRDNGEPDLSQVEATAQQLGKCIRSFKLVVQKSTVPVQTSAWIAKVMALNGAPVDYIEVASNPEFLREGTAITDFLYPERIVIGADRERAAEVLRSIYEPLTSGRFQAVPGLIPRIPNRPVPPPLIATGTTSAELIKYACNAFLATKVSFINAVANICDAVGADIQQVCVGIGTDSRIGSQFLTPGIGFGGSGFAKDLSTFDLTASKVGYDFRLLKEVVAINKEQQVRFMRKLRKILWTLRGKKLAILGLSYKAGTDDIRESPALAIVAQLLQEGCEVVAYDPAAMNTVAKGMPHKSLTFAGSAYEAAEGSEALVILTDWPEFANLDLTRLQRVLRCPFVIDGRNLYDPGVMAEHGLVYTSVGRPDIAPEVLAHTHAAVRPQ